MFKTIVTMRQDKGHAVATYTTKLFGIVVRVREVCMSGTFIG